MISCSNAKKNINNNSKQTTNIVNANDTVYDTNKADSNNIHEIEIIHNSPNQRELDSIKKEKIKHKKR